MLLEFFHWHDTKRPLSLISRVPLSLFFNPLSVHLSFDSLQTSSDIVTQTIKFLHFSSVPNLHRTLQKKGRSIHLSTCRSVLVLIVDEHLNRRLVVASRKILAYGLYVNPITALSIPFFFCISCCSTVASILLIIILVVVVARPCQAWAAKLINSTRN